MKRVLFSLVLGCLVLTGCSNEEKTMSCKRSVNQSGMTMDLSYNVSYKGSNVTNIESIEKITANDDSILEAYREQIEAIYNPYKNIKYYNYSISVDGDTLTSKTDIDYENIDTQALIDIDSANGQLIRNGKINIDTIKSYYENLGASCEK